MSLKTWIFGEKSEIIKEIIDSNFKILGRYLSKNMLCLTTEERESLSSDYLSEGLVVYDTSKDMPYEYRNGVWNIKTTSYTKEFDSNSWLSSNKYYIPFEEHKKKDPSVQLFILEGNDYSLVIGGVEINESFDVTISSDLPFTGKVVIK